MSGWDDPMGRIRELERELSRLRPVVARLEALAERLVYADCETWVVDAVHDALGGER